LTVLGWLDFGASEHRKALTLLEQFTQHDTVDELGLGTIRDAFADRLFPGTSTIQTRAGYFLIVPWVYQRLESRKINSLEFGREVRGHEIRVIKSLAKHGAGPGVIGISAQETLKRFPSSIYWSGLGAWGIRRFDGSQRQYHAAIDSYYSRTELTAATRDDDPAHLQVLPNWDGGLPPCPSHVADLETLSLTRVEASYLCDRIRMSHPDSLLAELCMSDAPPDEVELPWGHPAVGNVSEALKEDISHARRFSLVAWLATLLYQRILAREDGGESVQQQKRDELDLYWSQAINQLENERDDMLAWTRERFWSRLAQGMNARVDPATRLFVDSWTNNVIGSLDGKPLDSPETRRLISNRERALKGNRARVDNDKARTAWLEQAISYPMDYRWRVTVVRLLQDIQEGLVA
jgi:hypothetical protein